MFRRKLDSKKVIAAALFVVFFLISSFQGANLLTPFDESIKNEGFPIDNDKMSPNSADLNFTDPISGSGVNQTVRVYMENRSSSEDNHEYFTIPAPADNSYLTYSDLNFTFQNNYTTDYVLEGDSALFPDSDEFYDEYQFDTDEGDSYIKVDSGLNLTNYYLNNITDTQGTDSYFILNSTNTYGNGIANFTLMANFSESGLDISEIAAFLFSLQFNVSHVANLTIKMKDFYADQWEIVNTTVNINTTLGSYQINEERIINENLNYLNNSKCALIQFNFERDDTTEFNVTMYEFDLEAITLAELPINNQTYLALEFDLKGTSSTVNGFYAWIRTVNLTKAQDAELNITLYRANGKTDRTKTAIETSGLEPDYSEKIYSYQTKYFGDELSYFPFDNAITTDLELNNYFIVIKSNISDSIFRLVGIPWANYGDQRGDHVLKKTEDDGSSWVSPKDTLNEGLDASQFKINVTRGYMPSDFNNTLQIQNITLIDQTVVLTGSSDLKWGLGRWKEKDFPVPIANNSAGLFNVTLDWDRNITNDFSFNVSYHAIAYRKENATTTYDVIFDGIPNWKYNYSLDLNDPKFDIWNLTEFWYLYPEYLTAHNLTTPSLEQQYENTDGEQTFSENTFYKYVSVSDTIADASGNYLLNLTSANLVYQMHSYINYNGTLWETQGFMYGDNVSVSLDIQNEYGTYPETGSAKAFLFYPNGTKYNGAELSSAEGKIDNDNNLLIYAFDNQTIINITETNIIEGKYKLGYFWTNGSAIGCKQIPIYIDSYNLNISECTYDPKAGLNVLGLNEISKVLNKYNLLMASVNDTTGVSRPNYYHVNKTDLDLPYQTTVYDDYNFAVYLKEFLQNETIINPDENISFKVDIQNINPALPVEVRVEVKLVSLLNDDWIIAESSSQTKAIPPLGEAAGDTKTFDVDLTIPELGNDNVWKGVNSPIRKGGAKSVVSIYIEDQLAGLYESDDYALIINQSETEFEGQIITLKHANNVTGTGIIRGFERDECLYLPDNTTFIVNIYDQYYLSSYNQFLEKFSFKIDSTFSEIEINPTEIINGKTFEITATLLSELGDELSGKAVTCQYNTDGSWITIGTDTSEIEGNVSFTVNTLQIQNLKNNMTFRLNWAGDQYILSQSENFSVYITLQSDILSCSFSQEKDFIYRNTNSIIAITIYNRGTSNLRITDITFDLSLPVEYSIVQIDNIALDKLKPDKSTTIKIEVVLGNIADDQLNITATIIAKNTFSNEEITIEQDVSLDILDKQIIDYLVENFIVIMLLLIGLVIVIAYLLSKRLITEIEKPVEEEKKKPKRRGPQYVDVSKLPKSEEIKKEEETVEKEKQEKKKSVDLDTLLKKEGLKKKGKKFKK